VVPRPKKWFIARDIQAKMIKNKKGLLVIFDLSVVRKRRKINKSMTGNEMPAMSSLKSWPMNITMAVLMAMIDFAVSIIWRELEMSGNSYLER